MSGFGRKVKRQGARRASPAEMAYRVQGEGECRKIADVVATMLPASRGFVLVTADYGDAESFSNTSYVARMRRDDAARLLSELLDNWRTEGKARVTEPSVETATFLRESVVGMHDVATAEIVEGMAKSVRGLEEALLDDARDGGTEGPTSALALSGRLAVEALTIFDREMRARMTRPEAEQAERGGRRN